MTGITDSEVGSSTPGSGAGPGAAGSGTAGSGAALRQAREERGITAAALARRASISASYLSQLENGSRRLTPSLLSRLAHALGVETETLAGDPATRTASALLDLFATHPDLGTPSARDIQTLSERLPDVARVLDRLATEHVRSTQRIAALEAHLGDTRIESPSAPMPFETVRDFFSAHHNYIDELDTRAEHLATELGLTVRNREARLREYARGLGIRVVEVPRAAIDSARRQYDAASATLYLAEEETSARKAFQLACQIALTAERDVIEQIVARADGPGGVRDDVISRLIRIGLANYAAGALLLPYGAFLDAAQETRWDLDLLCATFDVGFETVCHRISTLQRPGQRGIPFALIRVDRAGNISKRQSAAPFHFSQSGGTCPLWRVYDSFSRPTETLRQLTEMPDGHGYLWITRAVTTAMPGFRAPSKTFAVGLGCDIAYASQTVYATGLDLDDAEGRTPIGPGCKVCDRAACPQRAFPFVGRTLQVDENTSDFLPYRHEVGG